MGLGPFKRAQISAAQYSEFDKLDGEHPWMKLIPDGHVSYHVRELGVGEIAYFNFALAKEMGLISPDHPHTMNSQLRRKLIDTFSLQIINEYDEAHNKKYDPATIKPKKFMASRYLQLQHNSKTGKTSGDGRGIWNGIIENKGLVWDVSSRGTGVTCLAPGAVQAKRPLRTGSGDFGYGCGQAEIDELYAAAILAETFYLQGIHTERVLCVIDLGKGYGIGVRAAPNLIRPAHLFLYLKQDRFDDLKKGVDYFIQRQLQNKKWKLGFGKNSKYDMMAEEICRSFARFAAHLDIEYIFSWLEWDGDNVLADAGIIDYGSVRQFGIRHDRYRYDDIERFSTNLNEQKKKARLLVQVYVQIADYLKTKKKKQLREFAKHPTVRMFDRIFNEARTDRLLFRIGFNKNQRQLIQKEKGLFEMFDKEFSYFERAKISGELQKVPDGINHPALFDMRAILRIMPERLLKDDSMGGITDEEFFKAAISSFAKNRDMKLRTKHRGHIQNFKRLYKLLVIAAAGKKPVKKILPQIIERSKKINRNDRITGNALINIVFEIMSQVKKGISYSDVQKMIDQLIYSQMGYPEVIHSPYYSHRPRLVSRPDLFNRFLEIIEEHKDDI